MIGSSYPNSLYNRISQNLEKIRAIITDAAQKAGRSPEDITIVAVTKNVGPEAIKAAIDCGITVAGESRFQEALPKIKEIGDAVEWHFIGNIQKNKVKFLPGVFSLVHSVDSFELADALNRRAGAVFQPGEKVGILLQVNIGEEATKHGVQPAKAAAVAKQMAALPYISLKGLMAIPPPVKEAAENRRHFKQMIEIKNEIESMGLENCSMENLSLGMSDDYRVAVEEGATHVRIGRALFGERDYAK